MSQIDHAEQRLSDAGLADDNGSSSSSSSTSSSSGGSNDNLKWIIIGSVAGGVVLIALIILAFVLIRRYRKRKAYNMVHKGNDNAKAASGPGMSGGLMPLWMHRSGNSGPNNGTPSIVATPPAETDNQRLRRYSQTTLPPSNRNSFSQSRDMFNADDGRDPNENDSLRLEGAKFKEEEFHSAYDGVDTGYGMGMGGDRRSQM